jgi:hypothetical protein
MDEETLTLLAADLDAQLALIDEVATRLGERAARLQPDDPARLESTAYQIHNLYNAVEDLLKVVAEYFDNQIPDTPHWDIRLLRRMSHDVAGVRPAVLSQESLALLSGLRSFRHFFRHAYGVPIDAVLLRVNLEKARELRPLLKRDIARFLRRLGGAEAQAN